MRNREGERTQGEEGWRRHREGEKGREERRKGDGEEAYLLAGDLWLWASEINLVSIAKLLRPVSQYKPARPGTPRDPALKC